MVPPAPSTAIVSLPAIRVTGTRRAPPETSVRPRCRASWRAPRRGGGRRWRYRRTIINGILFIMTLNSMRISIRLPGTGSRIANVLPAQTTGRSMVINNERCAVSEKPACFGVIWRDLDPLRLRGTPPSQGKRFSLPLLAGRATHRRDECLLCQSHEPVWRFPPTTLQELAH